MRKTIFLAILIYLNGLIVYSNNYYINSNTGNDSNSGTSSEKAWRSLDPVLARTFLPGDIINFACGSSWIGELLIKASGTEGNPITFCSYGSGKKPELRNPSPNNYGINITGSWIVVDGLMIKDSRHSGVRIAPESNHNVVKNSEITNTGTGISCYGSHNLFTRNYIHDLIMIVNTPKEVNGDDDHGAVAFWMYAPDNEISYNNAVNCKAPSYDYGHDGGLFETWGNGDNTLVHHNRAENCNGIFEFGGSNSKPGHGSSKNIVIAYNLFLNIGQIGAFHLGKNYHSATENMRFENNTIVQTEQTPRDNMLWFGTSDPPAGFFLMRNNIIIRNGLNSAVIRNDKFIHENNIYYLLNGAEVGYPLGPNEVIADPRFVDFQKHDFRIASDSPARNAGIDLGHSSDLEGIPIPEGKQPDIGAYEYVIIDNIADDDIKFHDLLVYPNPASETIKVSLSLTSAEKVNIKIFDLNGRLLLTDNFEAGSAGKNNFETSIGNLKRGNYLLSIKTLSLSQSRMIVVI
jgi:hypothetical protein